MKNEMTIEPGRVVKVPAVATTGGDMMSIIRDAVSNNMPVETLERMLDMQERIMKTQAQQQYAEAMHAVQAAVTPVRMSGYNEHSRKKYGRLEEMWQELRPLLSRHGFALSFGEEDGNAGKVRVACTIMHVGGHSEKKHLDLPPDTSGSKNAIQSIGSTTTYGRRYLVGMIFGVVFTNEDDDGVRGEVDKITEEQMLNICAMLDELPPSKKDNLLRWQKVSAVKDIPLAKYNVVVANLEKMIKENES
jgi:hypothetical protein